MNKKILITGAKGFLGKNVTAHYKQLGYETYGIGHGDLYVDECKSIGLDYWVKSEITLKALQEINQIFDVIIHCGGSGSVGFSIENPYEDFKKTVNGTLEILEYMRLYNPKAQLIYPSSPAVQGEHPDTPIKEEYVGKTASPYGYHKKIVEDLCQSYSEKYGIIVKIIRLFSVYGDGLQKQLLWDACQKLMNSDEVEFWGTGLETRDFIHISDVLSLIDSVIAKNTRFLIINGGSGIKYTIAEVVAIIKERLPSNCNIRFNNQLHLGNPIYYWTDITELKNLNWHPKVSFTDGVKQYVEWVKKI
jgi:UDP-glucose 4-epimerase